MTDIGLLLVPLQARLSLAVNSLGNKVKQTLKNTPASVCQEPCSPSPSLSPYFLAAMGCVSLLHGTLSP